MFTQSLHLAAPLPSVPISFRTKCEAVTGNNKKANLVARRKERIKLPQYGTGGERSFPISQFLAHPSGVESLLNTRALQNFQHIGPNTYRCTLHNIQILKFDAVPVLDLQITPTSDDCTVEMLSCRFEGSKTVERQNNLFSASMTNHITWEENGLEPSLEVDVNLRLTLEVYTKPFSLLPTSVVEKPGNLVMQSLVDRLVPLLLEQLLKDYSAWVEEQLQMTSQCSQA